MTQVLLREDVDSLGQKGDIVRVKPGYAFNYLVPQGLAYMADAATLRKQAKLRQERQQRAESDRKMAEEHAVKLAELALSFEVKVDHDGHMYGSVSTLDIANQVTEKTGIELEKRAVQLKHPIKAIGAYEVALRLKEGVVCTIHLKVVPEVTKA
jgi:large subunit ribosomal protein L9